MTNIDFVSFNKNLVAVHTAFNAAARIFAINLFILSSVLTAFWKLDLKLIPHHRKADRIRLDAKKVKSHEIFLDMAKWSCY